MASPEQGPLILSIDQGTSSTRVLIFASSTAELVTYHQISIKEIYLHEGWVEQDPVDILESTLTCVNEAVNNLKELNFDPADIKAVGITNQRETTILWDKKTGKPLYNAVVWCDNRTTSTVNTFIKKSPSQNKNYLQSRCGLPISTYFSAVKIRWLMDNCEEVATATKEGRCLFGTVDSWLLWNLTGGVNGGKHLTDVTNASRTMLMNIHSLKWDADTCKFFDIPMDMLPEIRSSSEIYGHIVEGSVKGVPISGILGDQQAALVGQRCLKEGLAKNTYGTGCFMLYNTGNKAVLSEHGLLTTVAYQFGEQKPVYALEGSVAVAGAAVQWLRDNLKMIEKSSDIEPLADTVDSTHDCYFVPAFSGLFCPYWEPEARGVICGLTQFTTQAHIARACLEAVCFQTRELLDAMNKDSGISISSIQVDGGMTANSLLMQLQADLTGTPVVRPSMPEMTALGAAMAAGSAAGVDVWKLDADRSPIATDTFNPSITDKERDHRYACWKKAIQLSLGWKDTSVLGNNKV